MLTLLLTSWSTALKITFQNTAVAVVVCVLASVLFTDTVTRGIFIYRKRRNSKLMKARQVDVNPVYGD